VKPRKIEPPIYFQAPPPTAEKLALTVTEAAEMLSMGKTNVFGLIKAGRLKVVRTGAKGRGIIVPKVEISAFLQREAS
jgi:excisionase family DNA binding protein